jgi:prohibitin 2
MDKITPPDIFSSLPTPTQGKTQEGNRSTTHIIMKTKLIHIITIMAAALSAGCYYCAPGERIVEVTLGEVSQHVTANDWGTYFPPVTDVIRISTLQQTKQTKVFCFSSDLQQIEMRMDILFAIPDASVLTLIKEYQGDPFETLIIPRLNEITKEVCAQYTAEQIVKKREEIKTKIHTALSKRISGLIAIRDTVINNIDLSDELEKAIEHKMVQEQEAAKAKFVQQKTQIEADTAIIKAKGEAEAIAIRGRALKENPDLINLQIVEKWNGVAPLVVGGSESANPILPLNIK